MRTVVLHLAIAALVIALTMEEPSPPLVPSEVATVPPASPPPPPPPVPAAPVRTEWAGRADRFAYPGRSKLTVRERPSAGAHVVATVRSEHVESGGNLDVLGSTRGFLHVRFSYTRADESVPVDGWVAWGEAVPDTAALLLDARSGAVLARLPLAARMSTIAFSPDGTHAVISGSGECDSYCSGTDRIYEVRTGDLSIARTVAVPEASGVLIASAFYDRRDGTLRVAVIESADGQPGRLSIATVDDTGEIVAPKDVDSGVAAVVPARAGRTALVIYGRGSGSACTTGFGVLDLESLTVRSAFSADGTLGVWRAADVVMNDDGSALYGLADGDVVAVSTATGRVVSRVPVRVGSEAYVYLARDSVVGDAVFLRVTTENGAAVGRGKGVWVRGRTSARVDTQLDLAAAAAGVRFGVDESGARLLRLDDAGAITASRAIDRADRPGRGSEIGDLINYGLAVTPDASRVVLFTGIEYG